MNRVQLTVTQYRDEVASLLRPILNRTEVIVPLSQALGHRLAREVKAACAVPPFTNSAMDGYGIRFADLETVPTRLSVVADIPAGSAENPSLAPGECVRIMTGAPVPKSVDTVVPVELTDAAIPVVTIREWPKPRAHIRAAGEDFDTGTILAKPGAPLSPAQIAAFAGAGVPEVTVFRKPTVGVLATGDEVMAPGQPLKPGQIFDTNSFYLAAALSADGATPLPRRVPDESESLVAALTELSAACDFIIVSGGASVGTFDVVRDVLSSQPKSAYRTVLMQPGKPQGWSVFADTPVISLPGNPLSTAISYLVFLRPLLTQGPPVQSALAGHDWRSTKGRTQFVPVALSVDELGRQIATPTHMLGSASHMVTSLIAADALAVIPETIGEVTAGQAISVQRV